MTQTGRRDQIGADLDLLIEAVEWAVPMRAITLFGLQEHLHLRRGDAERIAALMTDRGILVKGGAHSLVVLPLPGEVGRIIEDLTAEVHGPTGTPHE